MQQLQQKPAPRLRQPRRLLKKLRPRPKRLKRMLPPTRKQQKPQRRKLRKQLFVQQSMQHMQNWLR